MNLLQAGAVGEPVAVMSLAAGGGRVFAGNNRLQVREVASGAAKRTVIAGEPKDAEVVHATLYLGVYPYAQLLAYDTADAGVREVAAWDRQQNRPRDLAYSEQHDRLLIGTHSDELRRGALVDYHRPTGTLSIEHPLGGQSIESVTTAPDTAYLGGTGADARLVARDLQSGQQRWSVVPVAGGGEITGLALRGGYVHGLTANGTYFAARHGDGAVVHQARVVDAPGGEVVANRGFVYPIGGDALVAIDPLTCQPRTIISDVRAELFERPRIAVDERCSLYVIQRSEVLRLGWETGGAAD